MNNEQLWQAILGELEVSISKANFTTWFKNTFVLEQEDNKLIVAVPNTFTKTWLENKYNKAIISALKKITQNKLNEIYYKVSLVPEKTTNSVHNLKNIIKNDLELKNTENLKTDNHGLNPKYVFETFIVGKSNELAFAAAQAVAKNPGKSYNPLYIYGGVGLGKTHLLQAIGHEIVKKNPQAKLLYATSEYFTNQFVFAIRSNKTKEFQNKFRDIDVLIIDDIQFISGKEQTQEQLFHTFNDLHQNNKQIIFSSDRIPKAIAGLESRLESRFEWGMIVDIAEPDTETKIAIIEAKLIEKGFSLDKNIVLFLATNSGRNVREIEGIINRIIAHCDLISHDKEVTLEDVKNILQTINQHLPQSAITIKKIIKIVAEFYDVSLDDILSESRKKELVEPRQITMYLIREEIGSSFPNIGQELGGRDHTTAMHAYEKVKKLVLENDKIKQDIFLLKQKLYND
ncbi:MAG TPA: chromosomal replication initiator protein DnaA [bacterium]|nr:chromosomal replication initiator protein DnaA [bacterium]